MGRNAGVLVGAVMSLCVVGIMAGERPNIVLVMADDLGLGDVAHHVREFQGRKPVVATPRMDALARQGMWFTDGHSSTALCSPTRYCVMSGNLNYRSYAPWGVWGSFRESPFEAGEATLGRVAKAAGYATGFIGKWHLGGDFRMQGSDEICRSNDRGREDFQVDASEMVGGGPRSVGFDYDFTLPCGIQGPMYTAYENGKWAPFSEESKIVFLNKENALDPRFVSDKGPGPGDSHWDARVVGKLLADKAAGFIGTNAGETPFFLCYWSPTVHLPHCPPDAFNGVKVAGEAPTRHLDMIIDLDQQVGVIVDALKKAGEFEDTLIVVTSDNGGLSDAAGQKAGHNSNGGFRGHKNAAHEGGHRVPFFVTWPGKVEAGAVNRIPVMTHDILATMAALVGTEVPDDEAMDSLNILPVLTGTGEFEPREEILLQGGSRNEVIYRKDPWKLIIQSDHKVTKFEPTALFNLETNPLEKESENLLKNPEFAERVDGMLARYLELRRSGARTVPAQ